MKSQKKVLPLSAVVLPYRITFPETIEMSVNLDYWLLSAHQEITLTYPQYEALLHSSYAKHLI